MKLINENIYMKRLNYFNIYLIKGIDGDILIDTGFITRKRKLNRCLDKFNIKYIILTHAHLDHSWNANYLKERYDCKILMSKHDIENIDNSNINSEPSLRRYKLWTKVMNTGMKKLKQKEFEPDILIDKDKTINICGLDLKIVNLKGHTNGSIGVLYNNHLFAGDALVNRKRYVQIAYQNQNNDLAYQSLKKIVDLNPDKVLIGHDRPINNKKLMSSYERNIK